MTAPDRHAEAIGWGQRLRAMIINDRGQSVELRRLLTAAPIPTRAYWQLDPPSWVWPCELPMWLAGLAALRPRTIAPPAQEVRAVPVVLRGAHVAIRGAGKGSADAFERRFGRLLTCHPDDLRHELAPVIEIAARAGARLDYGELLHDLARWKSPTNHVQRHWAEAFWRAPAPEDIHELQEPNRP